ncbi:MAG: hypothetical protein ACRELG_24555 [Gemmataceae bacterium]
MYLFGESSGSGGFGFILFVIIMVMGMRQWCKWLKGNAVLRGAAKKGALSILGRLLKK